MKTKPNRIEQFDKTLQIVTPLICLTAGVINSPLLLLVTCIALTIAWAGNWALRIFM